MGPPKFLRQTESRVQLTPKAPGEIGTPVLHPTTGGENPELSARAPSKMASKYSIRNFNGLPFTPIIMRTENPLSKMGSFSDNDFKQLDQDLGSRAPSRASSVSFVSAPLAQP